MRSLRLATIEDMDMVYAWSNDPVTRAMSFNTAQIPYEDHIAWYHRLMGGMATENSGRLLTIMMDGSEPVGQMRFDREDDGSTGQYSIVLSYSIAPGKRGTGYGRELIRLALCYIAENEYEPIFSGISQVVAEVKAENKGSATVLVQNGFAENTLPERNKSNADLKDSGNTEDPKNTDNSKNPEDTCSSGEVLRFVHTFPECLYIRADMNKTIATGHVMRCLTIADAAASKGLGVTFLAADADPVQTVEQRGYQCIVLGTDWQDMEGELACLEQLISERNIKHLLVDSYQVTEKYLAELRKLTDLSYIDDVNAFTYPVDHLIVYANYYRKWNLESAYHCAAGTENGKTDLILGTDYVPLKSEYRNLPEKVISEHVRHILVLSGGSDNLHILKNILSTLEELRAGKTRYEYCGEKKGIDPGVVETADGICAGPGIEITAICGRYNPDREELMTKYNTSDREPGCENSIMVIDAVPSLKPYIQQADLVITAGGTTLYEICACGTPAITYSFADNQLDNVLQFQADGLMAYAGDVRGDNIHAADESIVYGTDSSSEVISVYDRITELIERYDDPELRRSYSAKMRKFIDGRGAERIIEWIMCSMIRT